MQLGLLFLLLFFYQRAAPENVLIWPAEGSHWINVKFIINELIARGHNVTVAEHSAAIVVNSSEPSPVRFEVIQVPFTTEDYEAFLNELIDFWINEKPSLSYWAAYRKFSKQMENAFKLSREVCDGVLKNDKLMQRLRESAFKVLLSDPIHFCGDLLAVKLGIPFIFSLRFSPGFAVEKHCGQMPAPPSYVPTFLSEFSDKMSFPERIQNVFYTFMYQWIADGMWSRWNSYYSRAVDGSHWINVKFIINELIARGHNVTVVVHSAALFVNYSEPSPVRFEVFQVPITSDKLRNFLKTFLDFLVHERPHLSRWNEYKRFSALVEIGSEFGRGICDGVLKNEALMQKLRESEFKVLLSDPVRRCGDLLAVKLGIPFIFSLTFSPAFVMESLCGQLPAPPSYVPTSLSEFSDKMSFPERVQNVRYTFIYQWIVKQLRQDLDSYYSEVLGESTTLCEIMGKAEIWLIRTYWDFEFPRPLLPNFVFVGGLHCRPANPLPQEMEEFVQSSGEHGIVIFSLGSFVKNLTDEKANLLAEALGQIPQKVIWRYAGKKPRALASNTKLYDWLPQNDLLGHPKTRAFITHGGTNGIYEAIYHGVPLVGIPLFADQPDNLAHMKVKGVAVVLNFATLRAQDLVDALNTVINGTRYKENAMKLSRIHHDQQLTPLERSVYWIEFVMRHGGAKHLRPAAHSLSWYQYHCLDVVALLATCLAAFIFLLTKCCLYCCRTWKLMKVQKNKTQ
ncbi:UDP-glucuronosyltransferase 2A1-like isoform X4 [Hemitrygon akajei]|uniref:UDP-glucuronosyltransferase 2A1-like isoform X4 n=1 Tax=Hemitrygon akajei TaxID=2704970 RepID=UPI003BF9FBB0